MGKEQIIQDLLSLNILKGLRNQNLITEEEFIAIDNENKKTSKWLNIKNFT